MLLTKMRGTLYLIASILWVATTLLHAEPAWIPVAHTFEIKQTGTGKNTWSAIQTTDQTIYFAGNNLITYSDGIWSHIPSPTKGPITAIANTPEKLWVAGRGYIGWYDAANGRVNSTFHEWENPHKALEKLSDIWRIYPLEDGGVLIPGRQHLAHIKPNGETILWELQNTVRLTSEITTQGIIIAQDTKGWWIFKDGKLTPFSATPSTIETRAFEWIREDTPHHRWLIQNRDGLHWFYPDTKETVTINATSNLNEIVTGAVAVDKHLYVSTFYKGIRYFNLETGETTLLAGDQIGIRGTAVYTILKDNAQNIWVTHDGGITRLHNPQDASYLPLTNTQVLAGIKNPTRTSTIATAQGTYELEEHTLKKLGGAADKLTYYKGDLILGLFQGIKYHNKYYHTGIDTTIATFPSNKDGVVFTVDSGGVTRVNLEDGQTSTLLKSTYEITSATKHPNQDIITIALANGQILQLNTNDNSVTTLIEHTAPRTVVALYQNQLVLLSPKSDALIGNATVLPLSSNFERTFLCENNGNHWLIGVIDDIPTIARIVGPETDPTLSPINHPISSAITNIVSGWVDDKYIYVAGLGGVLRINIARITDKRLEKPILKRLSASGTDNKTENLQLTNQIEIPRAGTSITVETRKSNHNGQNPNQLQARLLPVEPNWTAADNPTTWQRLAPGSYTLELRWAAHNFVSEPTRLQLSVPKPWYLTTTALGLYILGIALTCYSAFRVRTASIRRKAEELEALVAQRTEELREANNAKTEFVAAMSHEIRNPMNGVIGFTQILRDSPTLALQDRLAVGKLALCADQLSTTVEDILDFSKIEAGKIQITHAPFHPQGLVEAATASVDPSQSKVKVIPPSEAIPNLIGDAPVLQRTVTNYITNALKYGTPGEAIVRYSYDQAAGKLTISVENPGPAIPKEELAKLFTTFQRGQAAYRKNIRGNGLGLAICKKTALERGGSVAATSSDGSTIFSVTLPCQIDPTPQADASSTVTTETPKNLGCVLAIEDEEYNRATLGHYLRKMGYEIEWATNGRDALNLAEQRQFSLILTDWNLPDMNGSELAQKLRGILPHPQPPIIAVTAYSTTDKKDDCVAAGMSGFVTKPVSIKKLQAAIAKTQTHASNLDQEDAIPEVILPLDRFRELQEQGVDLKKILEDLHTESAQLQQHAVLTPKQVTNTAHKLVNLCTVLQLRDLAAHFRAVEGAVNRDEPTIANLVDLATSELDVAIPPLTEWINKITAAQLSPTMQGTQSPE